MKYTIQIRYLALASSQLACCLLLALCLSVGANSVQAQETLSNQQIIQMQSQAEADLVELLKRVKSAQISDAESQKLIADQAQKIADVQAELDLKSAELVKAQSESLDPSLPLKLEAEIQKVARLQAELATERQKALSDNKLHKQELGSVSTQLAKLKEQLALETTQRLETAKTLNAKLIEIADLSRNSNDDDSAKIKELVAQSRQLRDDLVDSRSASDELKAALLESQSQRQVLEAKSEDLKAELLSLTNKLSVAEKDIQSLKAELAKAISTQKWLAEQLKVKRLNGEALDQASKLNPQSALMALETDLLFPSGSTRLSKAGKQKVRELVPDLEDVLKKMPEGSDWVLMVEGHADATPIRRSRYKTNLALSIARALTVVRELTLHSSIEPKRIMAAGFGEYRPIKPGFAPEDLATNRRVEFRLIDR